MIRNLQSLGKTVLLTTHYMDEAQELAKRVAIIAKGEIVAEGSPASLGGRNVGATLIRFRVRPGAEPPGSLVPGLEVRDTTAEVKTDAPTDVLHRLTGWAVEQGMELEELSVARPTLEDVYLELTRSTEVLDGEQAAPPTGGRGRRGRR
jgi:ABC-2 type transport system ATP-binding protein